MALTDEQLAELHDELINDPKELGYDGSDDPTCAELLNTRGLSNETGPAEPVDVDLLNREVVVSEFVALDLAERQFWQLMVTAGNGVIDPADTKIVDQIKAIWGPATETRANLVALGTRPYSRAEALFDRGTSVTYIDVGRARTGDY